MRKQLSKERLEALASGNAFTCVQDDEATLMARALLAGMAQEPVGITDRSEIECLARGEMANVMPPDYKGVDKGDEVYLYAAPPAPVVTDGLLSAMEEVLRISDRDHEAWHRAKSAMDILKRAAHNMLADESLKDPGGALCGKRKPDAWIPCSEQMPEGMTDVSITDGINVGQGWWDGDTWQWQDNYYGVIGKVTHWQPLPAPPKER